MWCSSCRINHSETLQVSFYWSANLHVTRILGQIFYYFSRFEYISIFHDKKTYCLGAQLLLHAFHNHFETVYADILPHICV